MATSALRVADSFEREHVPVAPPYTAELCRSLPPFDRSVSLLCWAYNEETLIEQYLRRADAVLRRSVRDYEIILIDDCSTDRTNEIVQGLLREMPRIRLIRNEVNMNVGPSAQKAIRAATKDYTFWQTIDWSYDVDMLRIFLEFLRTHDVVAGVRRAPVEAADRIAWVKPILAILKLFGIKHLNRRSDTVQKALVSVINYLHVRLLFQVPVSDFQNVVFYPRKLVQSIGTEAISSFANPEYLLKAYWQGASIAEVPISFIPRTDGEAKGTRTRAIAAAVKDIWRLWYKWIVRGERPFVRHGSVTRLKLEDWPEAEIH